MFNRILIPLDGSILAERSIPYAEQLARIFGSTLVLLQVLDPTSYHENPKSVDPLRWQIRKTEADLYLRSIAVRIQEHLGMASGDSGPEQVIYEIREGKAAENIINFAHNEGIDLVVISTHGSGGLSSWNLSSVTQKVLSLIYLPILLIRAYTQPEAENDSIHYRRILVPIDSSRRAECSLPAAIALAQGEALQNTSGQENQVPADLPDPAVLPLIPGLILAAVLTPVEIPIPVPYPTGISRLSEQLYQLSREAMLAYLNDMRLRLPVQSDIRLVEATNVSTGVQELANQDKDLDLVLLCAHGYTGQSTWPYGSVARNYIEHGTQPVMIIQDVLRSQVPPTAVELAVERTGGR